MCTQHSALAHLSDTRDGSWRQAATPPPVDSCGEPWHRCAACGYGRGVISRAAAVLVTLVVSAGVLSGCVGTPDPVESTPLFASEAEAFAAAEQTYRNYVDALNQVDLSDPATFEPVYAWTTGDANAEARASYSQMHAEGWTVTGQSSVALSEPQPTGPEGIEGVQLAVCLDVSQIAGVDGDGVSMVSPDRRDIQSMLVSLNVDSSSPTNYLINSIAGRDGSPACSN